MEQHFELIEKQYFTITEVADMFGVNASLIRFWESKFPQLAPRKNKKGNRLYTANDIEILRTIHYLVKVRKFTLKGAREKMSLNPKDMEYAARTRETLLGLRDFLVELKNSL